MRALFTALASIELADASRSARQFETTENDYPRSEMCKRTSGSHGSNPRGRGVARVRRITVAAIGVLAVTLLAGTAQGRASVFVPAPAYPNSTLAIDLAGKPRAGDVVKVVVSGSNAPFEIGGAGSGDYLAYQLDAFAQNGKVVPECPRSFAEELQNEVNLGISRIAQGLPEGYSGSFSTPLRFRTSRKVRDIVVCAYSRMITDDVVVSALRFKLRRP